MQSVKSPMLGHHTLRGYMLLRWLTASSLCFLAAWCICMQSRCSEIPGQGGSA